MLLKDLNNPSPFLHALCEKLRILGPEGAEAWLEKEHEADESDPFRLYALEALRLVNAGWSPGEAVSMLSYSAAGSELAEAHKRQLLQSLRNIGYVLSGELSHRAVNAILDAVSPEGEDEL